MTGSSSCPECGTILRIRDRTFVGRRVSCPECKVPLRIESFDEEAGFAIRKLQAAELKHAGHTRQKPAKQSVSAKPAPVTFATRISRALSSPFTAACLLLAGVVTFFAVLMFNPRLRLFSPPTTPIRVLPAPPAERTPSTEPTAPEDPSPTVPVTTEPIVSSFIDDSDSLSALEPANLDGPIIWPPVQTGAGVANPPEPPPPVPIVVDVAGKMSQKLVSYKQPKVNRRHLLEALSEYLGAPIRYDADELGTAALEEQVSFEMKNVTVGDVIQAFADEAHWEIEIEATGLRLTRKKPSAEP